MERTSDPSRRSARAAGVAFHALWWFMSAGMMTAFSMMAGRPLRWGGVIAFASLWTGAGVAVCSALVRVATRLEVLSRRPAVQALAAIAGAGLGALVFCAVMLALMRASPQDANAAADQSGACLAASLTFVAWAPAAMFAGHAQRFVRAEREVLRARAEATELELRAVRQQVNSHLVFNALNSILAAVEEGSPRAASMVLDLSRLLRQSLDSLPHMGTLGDELARLELYARIERSRFEDELRLELDVAEAVRGLPCLPMVLQPLVENAIKHGFAQGAPPLCVELRATHRDGRVTVQVTNDGALPRVDEAGAGPGRRASGVGLGLRATRQRVEQEYGAAAVLELAEADHGDRRRVTATISWPAPDRAATP